MCTGTDCRAGRGEKELRERPTEDRTCACVYLCIMKPVQTNEPGERGGGVLSSELLYLYVCVCVYRYYDRHVQPCILPVYYLHGYKTI